MRLLPPLTFFSNMDVVSIEALNQGNKAQKVSAEIMKELLQYRLTNPRKGVRWFQILMGGIQDAQVTNACARVEWLYEEDEDGTVINDRPEVDLRPIENIRIDPGASWLDPINSSPYLIDLIPMYVGDVKKRMEVADKQGKTWIRYEDSVIRTAKTFADDSTRQARDSGTQDRYGTPGQTISDYEMVWIQRHIHRVDGKDWHFYTLSDLQLLSDPEPLKEVCFHGHRPYVIGQFILETHKPLTTTVPMLGKGLQEEANEIANQRLDNVKFVLNKAYRVKRGKNVDLAGLVRNVPGRVIQMDDPEKDVVEETWQDVTQSSYEEQNRINQDMDDLLGNFSAQNIPSRKGAETAKGMMLLEKPSSMLTEYGLRTFVETFVEPVLYLLMELERYYETDQTLLAIAGDRAQVFQKYGIEQVTDEMLDHDLTVKVNVGMGATDPVNRLNRFTMGVMAGANIQKMQIPGLGMDEVWKEIFGHLGYQDGRRFFSTEDPEKMKLREQVMNMTKMLQMASQKLKEKQSTNVVKLETAKIGARTKILTQSMKEKHEAKMKLADAFIEKAMPQPEQESDEERGRTTG